MKRPGKDAPPQGEDRFDTLLEERFGATGRREMASLIAAHDQGRPRTAFDREHLRRKLRFHGDIPQKVRAALSQWVPDVAAYAAEQGLRLRDLNHEVHFFHQAAFEADFGPIPEKVTLPASSYQFHQLYRNYTLRVVLPPELQTVSQILAVLRAALSRLFGDIFLREEIFPLEDYRENPGEEAAEVTAGLAEKIRLLSQETLTPPPLTHLLMEHARAISLNYKRAPDQVRRDFFQQALRALEEQKLAEMTEAAIESAFAEYMATLCANVARTVEETVAASEKLNGQLNFLPPDDLLEYQRLREGNPVHYLRSAGLRLNFLIETLGGLLDIYEELEHPEISPSPVLEEQLEGYLAEMRSQKLVRPYLIPGVQLSEELEERKAAFPFEVNALLLALPTTPNPEKAFKNLSNRLSQSIYQRLYHALLLAVAWLKAEGQGRGETFRGSGQFATLKGQAANFRFRRPLLEALHIRVGIVVELADADAAAENKETQKNRFPLEPFRRAWVQFIPHALVAGFAEKKGQIPGFEHDRYWSGVEAGLRRGLAGDAVARLALTLRELHRHGGDKGIGMLVELLRRPTGTFRFVVSQALDASTGGGVAQTLEQQLKGWAMLVWRTHETSKRNAILPGDSVEDGQPGPGGKM